MEIRLVAPQKTKNGYGEHVEMIEFLPSKCMILNSNTGTTKILNIELPYDPAIPTILECISK